MSTDSAVADEVIDAPSKSTALATLDPLLRIKAGLADLAAEAKPFDLTTTAGDRAARAFRAKCVSLRTSLDDAYETVNRPMLTLQRDARALLAELKASILAFETPTDTAIKAVEAAKEEARQKRIAAEAARIGLIRKRIVDVFTSPVLRAVGLTSGELRKVIVEMEAAPVDASFEDLKIEAQTAKVDALERLAAQLRQAEALDERLAQMQREKEELEAQRKRDAEERAAQKAKDDAERAERQAAEEAEREARRKADAETRAEQKRVADAAAETLAAERRAFEEEQRVERAAAAERQRQIDEAAEAERRQKQAIADAETAEREARERAHRQLQERIDAEEAAKRARVQAAQAQVERAAPSMLAALQMALAMLKGRKVTGLAPARAEALLTAIQNAIDEATVVDAEIPPTTTETNK